MLTFEDHFLRISSSSSRLTLLVAILLEVLTGFVHVAVSDCPGGWSEFSSSCYNVIGVTQKWDTAYSTCQGQDASLVEITSEGENTYVKGISNGWHIWLYCRDHLVNGQYVCGEDDHVVNYTAWGPSKPADIPGFDCVMFIDGDWSDTNCAIAIAVICEKDAETAAASTEQPITSTTAVTTKQAMASTAAVTTDQPVPFAAAVTTEQPVSSTAAQSNVQQRTANGYMQKDSVHTGYCLVDHVIEDIQLSSLIRCMARCISLPSCSSMNVFPVEGRCQLNNSNRTMSSSDFQVVGGCEYVEYLL